MREPKQVIVVRKDLNMRKGKMVAQGAHASLKVIVDQLKRLPRVGSGFTGSLPSERKYHEFELEVLKDSALDAWLSGRFTKICVYVNSEDELLAVYNQAQTAGLMCSLIMDAGLTEFGGVPTMTCCAIGPDWPEDIDKITGKLPLL